MGVYRAIDVLEVGKLFFFLSFGSWSLMDFVVVITFA